MARDKSRLFKAAALALLMACTMLAGCAVGNKHSYHEASASIRVAQGASFAVAAQDERPYVLSGGKASNFVGVQRAGFGNPYNVTTQSGKPLADDIATSAAQSLSQSGAKVHPVLLAPRLTREQAISELMAVGADKLLLINFTELKSDTYNNTAFHYRMSAYVCDAQGRVVAENTVSGRDHLGGSAFNPPAHAKSAVPEALERVLERLLNSHEISSALN